MSAVVGSVRAPLPVPRGPVSAAVLAAVVRPPHRFDGPSPSRRPRADVLDDGDLLLALHVCYELHYRGFAGVDDDWEWEPSLLAYRAVLEARLDTALRALVAVPDVAPADVPRALADLVAADDGPALAAYVQRRADLGQVRELLVHRSIYQLKEADPHTWAIPRLAGGPKAALVEVQIDEYGGGRPERMHARLFADAMREAGLDDGYGAYADLVPAVTLASSVTASYFGLHRSRRGAIAGHLAALEMTSSLPMRRYGAGLRRLGLGPVATRFFDEHVEADAVHEQIAAHDLCGALAKAEPELAADILAGAATCLTLDARLAEHLLACWRTGSTSLRGSPEDIAESA
ncbi:MAG TPA: iron-containing redox enzyme family protein [Mycobacteriales bacterium]|jgi:hypothetical protein|nr:iron-containing redox enzyme family protein [Mycobacteriales bacterium]